MALWTSAREGHTDPDGRIDGLAHHSDAGPQGEFNPSSQHLDQEVFSGTTCRMDGYSDG
jgi:hypothetical protein